MLVRGMYNIDKLTTNHGASIILIYLKLFNRASLIFMLIMQTADFAGCNKFIDTFPISLLTPFESFSPFYEWFEDESWLKKDKRKHHGAVDKRSS